MLSWLFPSTCELCGETADDTLCPACRDALPRIPAPICLHCGAPTAGQQTDPDLCENCKGQKRPFTLARQALRQTEETMKNARSAVENMYKRTSDYQNYISKYKPDEQTNVGEISEYYKSLLDSWDNIAGTYGQYKDADSYTKETTKLKELQLLYGA